MIRQTIVCKIELHQRPQIVEAKKISILESLTPNRQINLAEIDRSSVEAKIKASTTAN